MGSLVTGHIERKHTGLILEYLTRAPHSLAKQLPTSAQGVDIASEHSAPTTGHSANVALSGLRASDDSQTCAVRCSDVCTSRPPRCEQGSVENGYVDGLPFVFCGGA